MKRALLPVLFSLSIVSSPSAAARNWSDSTGQYTLDADLVHFDNDVVVVQRPDHELVAIPLEKLSTSDREYLKSNDAADVAKNAASRLQTWTLRDGTEVIGRVVDYAAHDITLQRRRGRIYVNDRVLDNLPEFYQKLVPQIVAHLEKLRRADRRSLESWLVRQRGGPRSFHLDGVILETENGDEYAVPFFMFNDEEAQLLKGGWEEWMSQRRIEDHGAQDDHAFLLQSLAAARHRDKQVDREIALLQLKLGAVRAGLTSLWEVTLYPAAGQGGPPLWVVVPGRDSRQATAAAMEQNPGYVAGPVRRVSAR